MTTYYDHHGPGPSTYEYRGDPAADENAMRRTLTRGSHQSHASGVSASTKSWVQSHQVNPPLPPDELDDETYSPLRRPRPLPDPQTQHYSPPRPVRLLERLEDDDMYMHANPNPIPLDAPFGYPNESGMDGSRPIVMNSPTFTASSPGITPKPQPRPKRGLGGFFKGLKHLPKMLGGGGGGNGGREKGKGRLLRKGTFGTEGTSTTLTATAMTRGNTLPRYLSNPSIGPSNPQFAHRLSMAVANGSLPPEATPAVAVFHPRKIPEEPRPPIVTVTAPSLDEEADFYGDEAPTNDRPDAHPYPEDLQERTTVMVYSDSQAPTVTQAPTQPVIPTRPPTPSAQVVPPPPTMRVSYPVELPTRANAQAQTEPPLVLTPTPVRRILSPQRPVTSIMSPRSILSPAPTSNYTISAAPSFYGRSFPSDLSPVEKFFKGLYHLPWVAHERVTVDYRPGDSDRAKNKVKGGVKKPMASWYRSVMSRSRRASLDLLSSGTNTLSDAARTSLGTSLSPLGSPISRGSRRSGGSSNRHRTQHATKQGKKKARRRTTSTTTTATQQIPGRKKSSPIIPAMYPYTYPGYPYAYHPYGTFPGPPIPQAQAIPAPRGPRHHKSHSRVAKYPHGGYAQYQPMAMTAPPPMSMPPSAPPIYVIAPSPPQSNGGDIAAQQGGPSGENGGGGVQYIPAQGPMQQMSPVLMHYVPGGYNVHVNQNGQMMSPPLTPQRPTAYGSS
jgi:hypothetical protein